MPCLICDTEIRCNTQESVFLRFDTFFITSPPKTKYSKSKKSMITRRRNQPIIYSPRFGAPVVAASWSSSPSLLFTSLRSTYFVHHKKTPNEDCMMFVVPNFRFRVGNQVELEKSMREALERKYGLNDKEPEEEEDWDGPGPNLVGNKTSQETKEEKLEKVRQIAVEQFQIQRKQYFAKRDQEMMIPNTSQDGSVENNNRELKSNISEEGTSVEETSAACDLISTTAWTTENSTSTMSTKIENAQKAKDAENDFFNRISSMPKPRTGGSSVHRAASMPTKKDSAAASSSQQNKQGIQQQPSNEDDKNLNTSSDKEKNPQQNHKQQKQQDLVTGFLDDRDESTYVKATYSFSKETMHMSPLAKRVFECEAGANISEVVIGKDFLTIRRKSREDLILEKEQRELEEAEAEEEAAAEQEETANNENEGTENEESQPKKKKMRPVSIYNDGQGEIIATSLGTLSGMVNTKKHQQQQQQTEKSITESGGETGNKTGSSEKQRHQEQVDDTRDKLSQMYQESAEKTLKATTTSSGGWQQKSLDDVSENSSTESKGEGDQQERQDQDQQDIVSVSKWFDLQFPITAAITDHLHFAEVAVDLSAPHPYADTEPNDQDTDVVSSIKELIAEHLRPLLQSDGGDIRFHGYFPDEGSIIKVEMLGSCKTCKKSDTTLRDLIERTIRHFVPEVSGVQEINGKLAKKKEKEEA